jgi:nitrogen fixation protein NifU and related proteins
MQRSILFHKQVFPFVIPSGARNLLFSGCQQGICFGDVKSTGAKTQARRITITAMYSAELLDHFQNPRNVGDVEAPDLTAQMENPACGDILKLTARLAGKQIADIRFRAKGCVPAMACGSAMTELIKGKTVEEARQVSREELVRAVGGLPQASAHASHLAIDTLVALLGKL